MKLRPRWGTPKQNPDEYPDVVPQSNNNNKKNKNNNNNNYNNDSNSQTSSLVSEDELVNQIFERNYQLGKQKQEQTEAHKRFEEMQQHLTENIHDINDKTAIQFKKVKRKLKMMVGKNEEEGQEEHHQHHQQHLRKVSNDDFDEDEDDDSWANDVEVVANYDTAVQDSIMHHEYTNKVNKNNKQEKQRQQQQEYQRAYHQQFKQQHQQHVYEEEKKNYQPAYHQQFKQQHQQHVYEEEKKNHYLEEDEEQYYNPIHNTVATMALTDNSNMREQTNNNNRMMSPINENEAYFNHYNGNSNTTETATSSNNTINVTTSSSTTTTNKPTIKLSPPNKSKCYTETRLFKAIEDREWRSAIVRVRHSPIEASMWVSSGSTTNKTHTSTHKLLNNDNTTTSNNKTPDGTDQNVMSGKLLPIHCACVQQAPLVVFRELLKALPSSIKARDSNGNLPIHYAVRFGIDDMDLLDLLLMSYPESIDAMDCDGLTAIVIAVNCALHPNKDQVVNALSKGVAYYADRASNIDNIYDSFGPSSSSNEVGEGNNNDVDSSPVFTEKSHTFLPPEDHRPASIRSNDNVSPAVVDKNKDSESNTLI